jgi:DNA topoisomerase-1
MKRLRRSADRAPRVTDDPVESQAQPAVPPPPVASALASAGLRYSLDGARGIRRRGNPPKFAYVDADGARVRDAATLNRIRRLAIPPAWTQVWICADENGHLQATGRDARGRKQYRYHDEWRALRDENKFHRLGAFARSLPAIRKAVDRDLAMPGLPREKVLAAMVSLLDRTLVRVGNERYRRDNGSFGLTTLRNRHVKVAGDRIRLRFRGKGGKELDVTLEDRRLARVLRRCLDLPGYELFQYDDAGEPRQVCATDVNDYLKRVAGADYTAKDFRTWGATMIAVNALDGAELPASGTAAARVVNDALRTAAGVLGNTLAVVRKSYVHPGVVRAFLDGGLSPRRVHAPHGLRDYERRALAVLTALERAEARQRGATSSRRSTRASRSRDAGRALRRRSRASDASPPARAHPAGGSQDEGAAASAHDASRAGS